MGHPREDCVVKKNHQKLLSFKVGSSEFFSPYGPNPINYKPFWIISFETITYAFR
jgi:hypothetical protein